MIIFFLYFLSLLYLINNELGLFELFVYGSKGLNPAFIVVPLIVFTINCSDNFMIFFRTSFGIKYYGN